MQHVNLSDPSSLTWQCSGLDKRTSCQKTPRIDRVTGKCFATGFTVLALVLIVRRIRAILLKSEAQCGFTAQRLGRVMVIVPSIQGFSTTLKCRQFERPDMVARRKQGDSLSWVPS
jgi:hypothetical protein